ncbi:MAG: Asp-tRNA(Asn)/Glu-tRNA(Gln) amidotransferase subunit GatB [Chlamydiales bacterium]|nr:Asp-tRNA(Asn)/Glu-tRNA(Gln) amidotransferase subunit GatB [Chlamydiales bacterium]
MSAIDYEAWQPVIGLEMHVQLNTKTKLFSRAPNRFGDEPNTNIGIPDTGQPGALPVLNREAVKKAVSFGCAINAQVQTTSTFDRKSYFYPDSPRNFQITQFENPIIKGGFVKADVDGKSYTFEIEHAHIEDDSGMLKHFSTFAGVDYNRAGAPLIEIVSKPCMHGPREASAYATAIKAIMQYIDASDCNMEMGNLRMDVNISVRPKGSSEMRPKIEIKNMNSFTHMEWAIEAEVRRQIQAYTLKPIGDFNDIVNPGTYRFDIATKQTIPMRTKEAAADYRYFPEPDLPPLVLSQNYIDTIRSQMPELPHQRFERYLNELKLTPYAASVLISDKHLSDHFEKGLTITSNAPALCNWITVEFLGRAKEQNKTLADIGIEAEQIAELVALIDNGTITGKIAKQVADDMMADPTKSPRAIVEANPDYKPISDTAELETIIDAILAANPESIENFKAGKDRAFNFLVGQIMKQTKGKADPTIVSDLLKKKLSS